MKSKIVQLRSIKGEDVREKVHVRDQNVRGRSIKGDNMSGDKVTRDKVPSYA